MIVREPFLIAAPAVDLDMMKVELVEGWEMSIQSECQLDELELLVDEALQRVRDGACLSGVGGGPRDVD